MLSLGLLVGSVQPVSVVLLSEYYSKSLLVYVLAFQPVALLVVAGAVAVGQTPGLLVEVAAATVVVTVVT